MLNILKRILNQNIPKGSIIKPWEKKDKKKEKKI